MTLDVVVFEMAGIAARAAADREMAEAQRTAFYRAATAALARVLNVASSAAPEGVRACSSQEAADNHARIEAERDQKKTHVEPDADLEKDVQKIETAARGTPRKEAAENQAKIETERAADPKPDASGAADAKATPDGAQSAADDKPLDYLKDVAPTLNKLAKANRDALVALFAKYGAKKGAELKAEDYAAVLGEATELLGAAG